MNPLPKEELKESLINSSIDKPKSGTLSGHAAGEPFDKLVYSQLKNINSKTYRQFEYLNSVFLSNIEMTSFEERLGLIDSKVLQFLLSRGKKATSEWSPSKLFEEKQNDTADIIITSNKSVRLIDVKTRNISKQAQPPNIISAYKLAKACALLLEYKEYDDLNIDYIGIDWKLAGDKLKCVGVHFTDLFKVPPQNLYINWAAAMQIQFNVEGLSQEYEGEKKDWAISYLTHFSKGAEERSRNMIKKFVDPFSKFIA